MSKNKIWIINWLVTFGIMTIIQAIWESLEMHYCGAVQPSKADAIIGLVMTISVYLNVVKWIQWEEVL